MEEDSLKEKVKYGQKKNAAGILDRSSELNEVDDWMTQRNLSKTSEDILGQSTPMDKSYENGHSSYEKTHKETNLDVSRVEVAGELQKQQTARLEKLFKCQSEQNHKIFEKLNESMVRQKRNSSLREQHARQMEDVRIYYEGEISGLKRQLTHIKNTISRHNQHEDSMKAEIQKQFESISAVNVELSSKCDRLEAAKCEAENHLKQTSCQKHELESQCQQLVATNQIIDARSHEIKRVKDETGARITELEGELKILESRCYALGKEKGILKNLKEKLERNTSALQEDNRKLTDKCHKWKEESRMFRDRNTAQEKLVEKSNKNVRELERVVETLKRELEDSKVKLDVDRSLYNATQQRVDRLVVQNRDKDLIIQDLEAKIQSLETTIKQVTANTAKAGLNEIRESVKRDKELLKRTMREYDSLNVRHEQAQDQVHRLEDKLADSQGEGQNLRKELSEINITRKNLENSLRQVIGNETSQIVERSTRKTWQQSENFNFFAGKPVRCDEDTDNNHKEPKISDNMESTRRETYGRREELLKSSQPEKDELITLSQIQSPVSDDRQRPELFRVSDTSHSHFQVAQDGSLRCSFCNQISATPVSNIDKEKVSYNVDKPTTRQIGVINGQFIKYSPEEDMKEDRKAKEIFSYPKGSSKDKSKPETDARGRRALVVSGEKRFLELSEQRRRLEAALLRISSSKMSRHTREDKKFLESKLDEILKEIGKLRLMLKYEEMG